MVAVDDKTAFEWQRALMRRVWCSRTADDELCAPLAVYAFVRAVAVLGMVRESRS
jgi:hypothetical protein